jgi:site-specific DNA-cytosine methylase
MNVLSLFDGISCGLVALKRNQIPVKYYACEIDKYAIQISQKNHPEIIHLGSVVDLKPPSNLDLLIGGSPCQDLSIAKKGRKGLDGERSGLFWEFVRILNESKPKYFILENVNSMSKESKQKITEILQVQPIMINASLVSAQCRKRLFWTNIPVQGLPKDRNILLKDILQSGEIDERMTSKGKAFCLDASYFKGSSQKHSIEKKVRTQVKLGYVGNGGSNNQGGQAYRVYSPEGKSVTLGSSGAGLIKIEEQFRKLTPIECERLQGLPDNYTEGISNTQRYKCLGNAFNVDVICFILSFIK